MRHYSIFFEGNPVFEGKDGNYWLSGSTKFMTHLIFPSRKEALAGLESIKKRILAYERKENLFVREIDKLEVKKCGLIPQ